MEADGGVRDGLTDADQQRLEEASAAAPALQNTASSRARAETQSRFTLNYTHDVRPATRLNTSPQPPRASRNPKQSTRPPTRSVTLSAAQSAAALWQQ